MMVFKKTDMDFKTFFAFVGMFYLNLWAIQMWVAPYIHPMSFIRTLSVSALSFIVGAAGSKYLLKKKDEEVHSK